MIKKKPTKRKKAMPKNKDLVLDLLKEVKVDIKEVKKDQETMKLQLNKIENCLERNTHELEEHKEGVIQNRGRISILENFIRDLKSESKIKSSLLRKISILIGIGVGSISIGYNVLKLLGF